MKVVGERNLSQTENDERFRILQYKVFESRVENVWSQFDVAGFEPILIKGWAAAQLYPEPYRRHFVDVDVMVAPAVFKDALEFSKSLKSDCPVDLHKGARHLDSLEFEDLHLNSIKLKCGRTDIRVLRPEDHLRLLCVHWLNDGGADKEKLWDIYYAIANRTKDFDWNRFLNSVDSRRRKWIVCTIGLAHKYLTLDIEDTPISSEAKHLPHWLVRSIEKEWTSNVRLLPLHYFLHDKKNLWKQIKKRIPPNAVQATIEMGGAFDNRPRVFYQIADLLKRMSPSINRISESLRYKLKY